MGLGASTGKKRLKAEPTPILRTDNRTGIEYTGTEPGVESDLRARGKSAEGACSRTGKGHTTGACSSSVSAGLLRVTELRKGLC